jgi:hypothetical protein
MITQQQHINSLTNNMANEPRAGDIWRCNNHTNAEGRLVKVTMVTPSFGRRSRVSSYMIDGPGQRDMNNDNWKWCHDFVSHGPAPPPARPSREALETAAWLDDTAKAWMRQVRAGWARGDRQANEMQ